MKPLLGTRHCAIKKADVNAIAFLEILGFGKVR